MQLQTRRRFRLHTTSCDSPFILYLSLYPFPFSPFPPWFTIPRMPHQFSPGDDLVFQLESGLGLLRILAIEGEGGDTVCHLLAYDEFFPDVEAAEAALSRPDSLSIRKAHMALTDRAFERTPAARLGNRPLTEAELAAYREWQDSAERKVSDRSALLQLGIR